MHLHCRIILLVSFLTVVSKSTKVNNLKLCVDNNGGRAITCPEKGNSATQCDGLMCIVSDADECRAIMNNYRCGVAFYTASKTRNNQFECKMVFGRDSSNYTHTFIHLKENVENFLFFKMYSGGRDTRSPSEAFLRGVDSTEVKFPRTKSTKFSTGFYYKSPLWNIRDRLGITTVTVAMHGNLGNDGADSCELTFAHGKGENGEWFNKENLFSSYPFSLLHMKNNSYSHFELKGLDENFGRREFYAMHHGGCPGDIGPMAVIVRQDACSWANGAQPLPRFICSAAWLSTNGLTVQEPNMNSRGRLMRELEVTGRLLRPVNILYAGTRDE